MDYLRISEEEAKNELYMRIKKCNEVISKFKKSYSNYYSSTGSTIFLIIILSIIAGAIVVFASEIISYGINLTGGTEISQGINYYSQYIYFSLYSISAYLGLYILRRISILRRVKKINVSIKEVLNIEKYLSSNLKDIDKITENIKKVIKNPGIVGKFNSIKNIDKDLDFYEETSNVYIDDSDSLLDVLANGMYWISSLAFGGTFIFVFGRALSYTVNWHKPHDLLYIVMATFIAAGIMGFAHIHKYLKKKNINKGIGSYTISLLCGPIAYPVVIGVSYIVSLILSVLIVIIVIAVIVGILAGIFSS